LSSPARQRSERLTGTSRHCYESMGFVEGLVHYLSEPWVPCHGCHKLQVMRWAQVRWLKGQPATAHYQCECCGAPWSEAKRNAACTADSPMPRCRAMAGSWRTRLFNRVPCRPRALSSGAASSHRPPIIRVLHHSSQGGSIVTIIPLDLYCEFLKTASSACQRSRGLASAQQSTHQPLYRSLG